MLRYPPGNIKKEYSNQGQDSLIDPKDNDCLSIVPVRPLWRGFRDMVKVWGLKSGAAWRYVFTAILSGAGQSETLRRGHLCAAQVSGFTGRLSQDTQD